jgi:nucleoside-diphosphate-sugar epimerase
VRILLTGASSFTGFAFAGALAEAGHEVVAPLRGREGDYVEGVRARRVAALPRSARVVYECPFGGDRFLELCAEGSWDLLCHHAAQVGDYRSAEFAIAGALGANTLALPTILNKLRQSGLRAVLLTGSVFEQGEGAGSAPLRAFSPYAVSKGLTAQVFAYWCQEVRTRLAKFVIPNPFGPFEEARFCAYLARSWLEKKTPEVRTPLYVRDNIHVDLLAGSYVWLCEQLGNDGSDIARLAPSGYVESQGAFAQRFAREFGARARIDCPLSLAAQTEFAEPAVRINTDPAAILLPKWSEPAAWDAVVAFYAAREAEAAAAMARSA